MFLAVSDNSCSVVLFSQSLRNYRKQFLTAVGYDTSKQAHYSWPILPPPFLCFKGVLHLVFAYLDGLGHMNNLRGVCLKTIFLFIGNKNRVSYYVFSWCFEPSQPQRITSGLKTNFNISPIYLFRKSLYHKSFFRRLEPKLYPQLRNTDLEELIMHVSEPVYICGHSTWEPASIFCNVKQGDLFYSAGPHRKNSGEVLEEMQVNGLEG